MNLLLFFILDDKEINNLKQRRPAHLPLRYIRLLSTYQVSASLAKVFKQFEFFKLYNKLNISKFSFSNNKFVNFIKLFKFNK